MGFGVDDPVWDGKKVPQVRGVVGGYVTDLVSSEVVAILEGIVQDSKLIVKRILQL